MNNEETMNEVKTVANIFRIVQHKEMLQHWLANDPIRRKKVIQELESTGDFDLIKLIENYSHSI